MIHLKNELGWSGGRWCWYKSGYTSFSISREFLSYRCEITHSFLPVNISPASFLKTNLFVSTLVDEYCCNGLGWLGWCMLMWEFFKFFSIRVYWNQQISGYRIMWRLCVKCIICFLPSDQQWIMCQIFLL